MSVRHAPPIMDRLPERGELLCSEPWGPCWLAATVYRETPSGYSVTCMGCGIVGDAHELPVTGDGRERS